MKYPADSLWLLVSHHYPSESYRCIAVKGRPVCRRCAVLYPFSIAIMLLQFTPVALDQRVDPYLLLFALPAILDFVLERLNVVSYNIKRISFGSALASIALGRGFYLYLRNHTDPLFWRIILLGGGIAFAAAMYRGWREHVTQDDESRRNP